MNLKVKVKASIKKQCPPPQKKNKDVLNPYVTLPVLSLEVVKRCVN